MDRWELSKHLLDRTEMTGIPAKNAAHGVAEIIGEALKNGENCTFQASLTSFPTTALTAPGGTLARSISHQ